MVDSPANVHHHRALLTVTTGPQPHLQKKKDIIEQKKQTLAYAQEHLPTFPPLPPPTPPTQTPKAILQYNLPHELTVAEGQDGQGESGTG